MNIYSGLLFLHGHIADAGLARQLVDAEEAARVARTRAAPETVEDDREVAASACPAGRGSTSGFGG